VYIASHIKEVFDHYALSISLPVFDRSAINYNPLKIESELDFSNVKGQNSQKRSLEIWLKASKMANAMGKSNPVPTTYCTSLVLNHAQKKI
jgi:predicted ATPase with chaperone activity